MHTSVRVYACVCLVFERSGEKEIERYLLLSFTQGRVQHKCNPSYKTGHGTDARANSLTIDQTRQKHNDTSTSDGTSDNVFLSSNQRKETHTRAKAYTPSVCCPCPPVYSQLTSEVSSAVCRGGGSFQARTIIKSPTNSKYIACLRGARGCVVTLPRLLTTTMSSTGQPGRTSRAVMCAILTSNCQAQREWYH